MYDSPFLILVLLLFLILSGLSIAFIASDFRDFNLIKKECNTQGYIQNDTTRIYCKVENAAN